MKNLAFSILALITMGGCSATGTAYSSLPDTLQHPKDGMAQLVIYRPESFKYMARTLKIDLDYNKACDLANGSFFIKDIDPAKIDIAASLWGLPGTSHRDIKADTGKQYFMKVAVNNAKFTADANAEVPNRTVDTGIDATSSNEKPFLIELMDKKAATAELQTLTLSKCN